MTKTITINNSNEQRTQNGNNPAKKQLINEQN